MANTVEHKLYVHRGKDANFDDWRALGGQTDTEAEQAFKYTGYEVCFHCMVDLETGECVAYGIDANDGKGLVEFSRPFRI